MANEYRVTTNVVEVLAAPSSNAYVTTNAVEVLFQPDSEARVSSVFVQVLRTIADAPLRRRQMVNSQ